MNRRLALLVGAALLAGAALLPNHGASASVVQSGGSVITVEWHGPAADLGQDALLAWIQRAATIVAGYYGEFPTRSVTLQVTVSDGDRVMSGRTFGTPQPRIELRIGSHVSALRLQRDWILVHEMIHLAAPALADEQNWLAEGLATYVEGIARVQAGNLSAAELWSEYLADMPQGLPQAHDRGLDRTHTWARTYWGGALFCLIADVRIHEETGNRAGLQDALRAIQRAAGGMGTEWPVDRVLAIGDQATGTTVLTQLYAAMSDRPVAPDLAQLWNDLGIRRDGDAVRFDEVARLAGVRRALTAPVAAQ